MSLLLYLIIPLWRIAFFLLLLLSSVKLLKVRCTSTNPLLSFSNLSYFLILYFFFCSWIQANTTWVPFIVSEITAIRCGVCVWVGERVWGTLLFLLVKGKHTLLKTSSQVLFCYCSTTITRRLLIQTRGAPAVLYGGVLPHVWVRVARNISVLMGLVSPRIPERSMKMI